MNARQRQLQTEIDSFFARQERKRNLSSRASGLTRDVASRVSASRANGFFQPLPSSKFQERSRATGRTKTEEQVHPEMFACKNRHGKILGTSPNYRGAMGHATNDKSYAVVRGEYTSDGTNHGVGGGRIVAVRENGRWQVG